MILSIPDDLVDPFTKNSEQDESNKNRRKGKLDIDDAHDDGVGLATRIGGDQADNHADQQGKKAAHDADGKGNTQAIKDS